MCVCVNNLRRTVYHYLRVVDVGLEQLQVVAHLLQKADARQDDAVRAPVTVVAVVQRPEHGAVLALPVAAPCAPLHVL